MTQELSWRKSKKDPLEKEHHLGGTGLGLAIVKHIAHAHDGHVSVKSTPGTGSTFSLHLPMR